MAEKPSVDLLIKHAAQVATPVPGSDFEPAGFLEISDGAVAVSDGVISFVGSSGELEQRVELKPDAVVIDASGKTVTPGFVDCHTHPIFFATREQEFEMRVLGKSYEEIALAGGGIRSSVRSLRQASKEELIAAALPRLDRFLSLGTTTVEAKSGYGLSLEDEIKSLEVIAELDGLHPIELVPTFLGAHETPDEFRERKAEYLDVVVEQMIPAVKERGLAEFCDVFCESHVFSVAESRRVLEAAKRAGFGLKIHAEQLTRTGGAALAAELGAASADHLEYSDQRDWARMKEQRVVPVLLPGADFFLNQETYAPARKMLEAGLPIAIATDFNPGTCMSESMPLTMTLACLKLRLRPSEALIAATYHAAMAINRGNLLGSIEVGKNADLVLWDAPNYHHLPYHFGVNLVNTVIKSGKVVYQDGEFHRRKRETGV